MLEFEILLKKMQKMIFLNFNLIKEYIIFKLKGIF